MLSSPGLVLFTTQSKLPYAPQPLVSQAIYYAFEFIFFSVAYKTKASAREYSWSFIGVGHSEE